MAGSYSNTPVAGIFTPQESPFDTTTQRNTWASNNKELLFNSRTQIVVRNTDIVDGLAELQVWGGNSSPTSYSSDDWVVSSTLDISAVDTRIKTVAFDPNDFTDGQLARYDSLANKILPAAATQTDENIGFTISGKFPAGSIWVGEVFSLSDMGANIGVVDSVDDVKGVLLSTRWGDSGTIDTRIPNVSAYSSYSQPLYSETRTITPGNTLSWQPPVAPYDLVQTQVILKSVGTCSGFNICIRYSSASGPLISRNTIDLVDGDNTIPLTASITRSGLSLYITYSADQSFTLRGATVAAEHLGSGVTQFVPYYIGKVQAVTYNDIGGDHVGDVVAYVDGGGGTVSYPAKNGSLITGIQQSNVSGLSTRLTTIESDVDTLQSEMSTAQSDIDTLESSVSSLSSSIAGKATSKKRYVDYNANDNGFSSKETIYEFTIDGSKETISSAWLEWRKTGISSCSARLRIEYGAYGNSAHSGEIYFSTTSTQSSTNTYQTTLIATGTSIPNEEEVPLKVTVERTSGGDLMYSNRFRAKVSDK